MQEEEEKEKTTMPNTPTMSTSKQTIGWFIGWLVGWLIGWLIGWLVGWLIDWLVGWLIRVGRDAFAILPHLPSELLDDLCDYSQ